MILAGCRATLSGGKIIDPTDFTGQILAIYATLAILAIRTILAKLTIDTTLTILTLLAKHTISAI